MAKKQDYLTLLPDMDAGFHTGYQGGGGIVSDHSPRPSDWLESFARNIHADSLSGAHAVPDVLALEESLLRCARRSGAKVAGEIARWRGVLALLLLWDTWQKDATWPVLSVTDPEKDSVGFAASVLAAMKPSRSQNGIRLFTLTAPDGKSMPLGMLSRVMAIVPAADLSGEMSMPMRVSWYREHDFSDPCDRLPARDRAVLTARLRLLADAVSKKNGAFADAVPGLYASLERFSEDLTRQNEKWIAAAGDDEDALRIRLLAVLGSRGEGMPPVTEDITLPAGDSQNPLLTALLGEAAPYDESSCVVEYSYSGTPFAAECAATLVQPSGDPGEETALSLLKNEIALRLRYDVLWCRETASALRSAAQRLRGGAGVWPPLPDRLDRWAAEIDASAKPASAPAEIICPVRTLSGALKEAVHARIGLDDEALLCDPFTDSLTILPKGSLTASEGCLTVKTGNEETVLILPFSEAMCHWLQKTCGSVRIDTGRVSLRRDGAAAVLRVPLLCRHADGAAGEAVFEKRFTDVITAAAIPAVTLWPDVRLKGWRSYFLHLHGKTGMSASLFAGDGSLSVSVTGEGGRGFSVLRTTEFPEFICLYDNGKPLGTLINDRPQRVIRHEDAAACAIDFGSVSTAVFLRQGDQIQPALLPEGLHGRLLCPADVPENMQAEEFVPENILTPDGPVSDHFRSVQDLFTDDPALWRTPLCDGHIYYPADASALFAKSADRLYTGLKWGNEEYSRLCLRLFLKQVMLQAGLSAMLWGSGSISWRVAMPGAMPLPRREAYLEMLRGLAKEVAAETGLPLTAGCPAVLYTDENRADGCYFLSRSEVSTAGGYLNLDIGGSTCDLSLWLKESRQAAMAVSLPRGCREMLFPSLVVRHGEDLLRELTAPGTDEALAQAVRDLISLKQSCGDSLRGTQKCMLLLDELFAAHADTLRDAMREARARGSMTAAESLLLLETGLLMYLCGDMLRRAYDEPSLRPMLPARMELCIAGNGGRLFDLFDEDQQLRLCSLAMARLQPRHPLQELLPILSRNPKQEVARGLLYDDRFLTSALRGDTVWNGTLPGAPAPDLLGAFIPLFARTFPQAAARIMPRIFSETDANAFGATALAELETVCVNHAALSAGDDLAMYLRAFEDLKRIWRI